MIKRTFRAARAAFSENFKRRNSSLDGAHAVGLSLLDNGMIYLSPLYMRLREAACRCTRPGVQRILDNLESAAAQADDELQVWINEFLVDEEI